MESWRFLMAVVLMIAVVVVTNLIFSPAPPGPGDVPVDTAAVPVTSGEGPSEGAPLDTPTVAREQETTDVEPPDVATPDGPPPLPAGTPAEAEPDTVVIESPIYRYAFTTRGISLVRAELLRHQSFTREGPVDLVPVDEEADGVPLLTHRLRVGEQVIDLRQLDFEVDADSALVLVAGSEPVIVRFRHQSPNGLDVDLEYEFRPDRYSVSGRARVTVANGAPTLLLGLGPTLATHEADPREDQASLAYVVNGARDGIRSVRLSSIEAARIEEGPLVWAALKNKYFVAGLLPPDDDGAPYGGLIVETLPAENAADLTATLPDADADGRLSWRLYLGPQDAEQLAAVGHDFQDVNPIGWRIFRPIISPLAHLVTWAVVGLHNILGFGYGWVLIVFGFIVRALLWPLNAKAMRAQLKNMEVQPLLKEVQAKYKNDPERLQKEMLRLYKEEGFNPLGGCLPMLIPFPVLITLFFVFQNTIEFRGVEFLWLPDLSRPDPLYLLPILLGVSMFVLQWISLRSAPQDNPQMKMMMWFMPIFMVVIFLNLASGLNLYYAASNVATVPQQLILMKERKRFHAARPPKPEEKPPPKDEPPSRPRGPEAPEGPRRKGRKRRR